VQRSGKQDTAIQKNTGLLHNAKSRVVRNDGFGGTYMLKDIPNFTAKRQIKFTDHFLRFFIPLMTNIFIDFGIGK
jgi:hypothetical protein